MKKHEAKEHELRREYGSQFEKEAKRFTLNRAEQAVIDKWIESLKPEIMSIQGDTYGSISPGTPYYGAISGGLTYSFIPTGLGNIIIVKESITKKELNVSHALEWYFFD